MVKNNKKSKPKQPDPPSTFDDKLRDFLDEDYNKVYYLLPNRYGDVKGQTLSKSNVLCKEAKRMSLYRYYDKDVDNMKPNHRTTINKLVIDADEGVYKTLSKIQGLLRELQLEYWIVVGTDNPTKPTDSGSIIIKFQRDRINKKRFGVLVKCLNMQNGGDLLNIGYMFKNPQWNHVKTFEKIQLTENSISFESLYNGVLNYYNITEDEVIEQYSILSKNEFDDKVLKELAKDIPDPNVVKSCYYRCNQTPELTEKVEKYLNNTNLIQKHKQKPTQYARYMIVFDTYFNPIYDREFERPMDVKEKYNISEGEERYWYAEARQGFNEYALGIKDFQALGFNSNEIEHILSSKRIMLEVGHKRRKENNTARIEEIKDLNKLKLQNRITKEQEIELKKLTEKNAKTSTFIIKGETKTKAQYITNIKRDIFAKEYIFMNYTITKDYIIENFFGGNDTGKFREKIKKFGIVQSVRYDNKTKHLLKEADREKRRIEKENEKIQAQQQKRELKQRKERETLRKMQENEYINLGFGCYNVNGNFEFTNEYWIDYYKNKVKNWLETSLQSRRNYLKYKREEANFDSVEDMRKAQREDAKKMMQSDLYGNNNDALFLSL